MDGMKAIERKKLGLGVVSATLWALFLFSFPVLAGALQHYIVNGRKVRII